MISKTYNLKEISRKSKVRHHALNLYSRGAKSTITKEELEAIRDVLKSSYSETIKEIEKDISKK